MNELKPCPFHKPNPDSGISWCDDDDDYWCECAACGAQGPYGTSPEHAAELWDCRLDAEQKQEVGHDSNPNHLACGSCGHFSGTTDSNGGWCEYHRTNGFIPSISINGWCRCHTSEPKPDPELEEAVGLLERHWNRAEFPLEETIRLEGDILAYLRRVGRLT